jgi:hypothetical protein
MSSFDFNLHPYGVPYTIPIKGRYRGDVSVDCGVIGE